jgi:DNA-binding PadR family transcriptional regulator
MERKLLLLGLLRSHEMHGYQLNEFIDSHLRASVHLKKPTAYRLLNNMAEDGWVTYREEQEGNRPPRRVYAITPQGEAAFQQLLRQSLADYKPVDFPGNIGLLFLDALPVEEALSLLQKRRAIVESMLQMAHTHEVHHESYQLLLLHRTRHLSTELEWLDEVIARLKSGSQDHSYGEGHIHQGHGETGVLPHQVYSPEKRS